jgi:serine/threonine-protein kinase
MSKEIETRIIKVLLSRKIVTQGQIEDCLAIRREVLKMGLKSKPLLDILQEKKYLAKSQADKIEAALDAEGPVDIPGYQILGTIGKGAMGTVYKGYQKSMEREVAIKVLAPQYARNESYVERFLTEAKMAARVKHTNIITGIDVGQVGRAYFLVMEYFPGRPVNTLIYEEERLPLTQAVSIARQIADALCHAHRSDLVHRDIKPENILLDKEGTAKLCDMGLAKIIDREGEGEGETVGTPLYISPELVQGRADVDIRSDIYSLGATLYHMILGRPPFIGGDAMSIMKMHVDSEVVPPIERDDTIPKVLSDVVTRMLQKDPASRFQTPEDLLAALDEAKAGIKDVARPEPLPLPMAPEPRGAPPAVVAPRPAKDPTPLRTEAPKRKKHRQSRSSSTTYILVIIAAVVLLALVVLITLDDDPAQDRSTTSESRRKKPRPTPSDVEDVPASVPGPANDHQTRLEEARRFFEDHPLEKRKALEKFDALARLAPATAAVEEARKLADKLRTEITEAVKEGYEAARSRAKEVTAKGVHIERAVAAYDAFLGAFRGMDAEILAQAVREKEAVETEIARRWNVTTGDARSLTVRKDYRAAARTVLEAVSDKGYADADTVHRITGDDPRTIAREYQRLEIAFRKRAAEEAGPRFRALQKTLLHLFGGGKLDDRVVPPAAQVGRGLSLCEAAGRDALMESVRPAVAEWVLALTLANEFVSAAPSGLSRWASRHKSLHLANEKTPWTLAKVEEDEGMVFFSGPARQVPLADVLARLDHDTLYNLAREGLGGARMTPDQNRGAAIFLALSPRGAVKKAVEKIDTHIGRAGFPLEPPKVLADLRNRLTAGRAEEDTLAAFETLRAESSRANDKRQALAIIRRWKAFCRKYGDSRIFRLNEPFIEKEFERLDKLANPPKPVSVPGLAVKAKTYHPKTGAVAIEYTFSERNCLSDWLVRAYDFGTESWSDYPIDTFLGRDLDVKIHGGSLSLSGGGFLFWKPRLKGDFVMEVDILIATPFNQILLFHMTDNGGYAFTNDLRLSNLATWATSAGVTVNNASGSGLFTAKLSWPPTFEKLNRSAGFRLAPKRWHALRVVRKGPTITAEVSAKGQKTPKIFTSSDEKYGKGRFGICLMKSGLKIDNFRVQGTFDTVWIENVKDGDIGDRDLPGTPR